MTLIAWLPKQPTPSLGLNTLDIIWPSAAKNIEHISVGCSTACPTEPFHIQNSAFSLARPLGFRKAQFSPRMAAEWTLDFCLVCDRQTLGAPYCSQSCRLAELDLSSEGSFSSARTPSTEAQRDSKHPTISEQSSPHGIDRSASPVSCRRRDFPRLLSPSSSQTSLSSLKAHACQNQALQDRVQTELRDYASCFDQTRDLKRQLTS